MKIADIKSDGTLYWFERGNEWGTYTHQGFDRHPLVRIDDKRYNLSGYAHSPNRTGIEDPKGRYVATHTVDEDGTVDASRVRYVLAVQIRDTYKAVMALAAKRAADKIAERERVAKLAEAKNDEADELRDRMTNIGIDDLFHVRSTTGTGWKSGDPKVIAEFTDYDASRSLRKLIERLEAEGYGQGKRIMTRRTSA